MDKQDKKNSNTKTVRFTKKCYTTDISDFIFKNNCDTYFGRNKLKAIDGESTKPEVKDPMLKTYLFPSVGISKWCIPVADGPGHSNKESQNVGFTSSEPLPRGMTATLSNSSDVNDQVLCKQTLLSPPPPSSSSTLHGRVHISPSVMVVAVDATPTRVGGLLRLSGRERTIFYYSVNWTNRLRIADSTKFEMVNTALALELFEPYLKAYRTRYDQFYLKTDSHFYESLIGFKDSCDFDFLVEVRTKLKSFGGEFKHTTLSQKDPDIQNADYLSRTQVTIGLKVDYSDVDEKSDSICNYAFVDLSTIVGGHVLDIICNMVPEKYLVKE